MSVHRAIWRPEVIERQWTTEPPTKMGYYWWGDGKEVSVSGKPSKIFRLVTAGTGRDDDGNIVTKVCSLDYKEELHLEGGYWLGPIGPPDIEFAPDSVATAQQFSKESS